MRIADFAAEIETLVDAHARARQKLEEERAAAAGKDALVRQKCATVLDSAVRPVLAEATSRLAHLEVHARLCTVAHGEPGIALEVSPEGEAGSCSRLAFHCDPSGGLHVNADACKPEGRHGRTENIPGDQVTDERVREEVLHFLQEVLSS